MKPNTHIHTAIVAALFVVIAKPASSQVLVDQSSDAFNAPNPSGELGGPTIADFQTALQTFTAGLEGVLDSVEVQVQQAGAPSLPDESIVLTILGTNAGVPDFNQNLGSVSLPASSVPPFDNFSSGPFTSFDTSGLGIAVTPGDVLALALSYPSGSGSYFVYDAELDNYSDGSSYIFGPLDNSFFETPNRDLGFRTNVLVPEPASLALLSLGGLLIARRRR